MWRSTSDEPIGVLENLFFEPNLQPSFELNREESRHACRALRLQAGHVFWVTDGKGVLAKAKILNVGETCLCEITESKIAAKPNPVHIAAAPVKNMERMEWMTEKCTEMGAEKISFFFSRHSERRKLNMERLEKIAVSAMKQSHQCWLPVLRLVSFDEILQSPADEKFIAHLCGEAKPLITAAAAHKSHLVLIGPEGDFSPSEVQQAKEHGFVPVSLSQNRLRTETAGVVACCTLQLIRPT